MNPPAVPTRKHAKITRLRYESPLLLAERRLGEDHPVVKVLLAAAEKEWRQANLVGNLVDVRSALEAAGPRTANALLGDAYPLNETALGYAILRRRLEVFRMLVASEKIDVNAGSGDYNVTPLHRAAEIGEPAYVERALLLLLLLVIRPLSCYCYARPANSPRPSLIRPLSCYCYARPTSTTTTTATTH